MARSKSPKQKEPISTNPAAVPAPRAATDSSPSDSKSEPKKMGIIKGETRPNLVPINLDNEVRRRAYELAEQRGFESGHETEDWLNAEHEVLQR